MKSHQSWMLAALGLSLFGCVDGNDAEPTGPATVDVAGRDCTGATVGEPTLRRLTGVELENTLRDIFPEIAGQWLGVRLGPDPLSSLRFSNDAEVLQVGDQTADEILQTAEEFATLATAPEKLPMLLPCATTAPDDTCAAAFIDKYGMRLYRRPLSTDERAELLALFSSVKSQSDFQSALKWTLVAMLQSPEAIYRSEIGAASGGRIELSQYEIASELAYTFGGSTPGPELLEKAAAGALGSEEAIVAEAKSLLETPRGRESLHRFLSEWIGYTWVRGKAKTAVTSFAPLGDRMIDETQRFLDEVVYTRRGGLRELLTAPYTFVNSELSQFYGYGDVGGDFMLVQRPSDWGVGILSQGSILAGRAQMDSSSPTLRGLFVFERFMCGEVPPPPADIPPIETPKPGVMTTRDRYEKQHMQAGCDNCHKQFDPTGFAFEHFDEAGRYRADEGGLAIDTSGYVWTDGKTTPVDGVKNLAETLLGIPDVAQCVSTLAAIYAYGGVRGAECGIEAAQKGFSSEEYGLLGYYARLAATEHFRFREMP